jgi:site-specific recombinase XerD
MNFSVAMVQYIGYKRENGYVFQRGSACLFALSRRVGDIELEDVCAQHVLGYLDGSQVTAITWRMRYQILSRFFCYWSNRGVMPELPIPLLPPGRAIRNTFVPYIYSRTELRGLLRATAQNDNSRIFISRRTMRMFLLLLYGTGGLVGEILNLCCSDVDLRHGILSIRSGPAIHSRQIPLGKDLHAAVSTYMKWRMRSLHSSPLLFITKRGKQISGRAATKYFERIRKLANVSRRDGSTFQPRMQDLRYTFAVHRITSWTRNGADLNRMLPALAAYMGHVGLGSTERYLALTPERFRKHLEKLSPTRGRHRWRNDQELMAFLSSL